MDVFASRLGGTIFFEGSSIVSLHIIRDLRGAQDKVGINSTPGI